jgi:hypothetical protein
LYLRVSLIQALYKRKQLNKSKNTSILFSDKEECN